MIKISIILIMLLLGLLIYLGYNYNSNIASNPPGPDKPLSGFVIKEDLVKDEEYTEIPYTIITRGEKEEVEYVLKTTNETDMRKSYTFYILTYQGDIPIDDVILYINGEERGSIFKKGTMDGGFSREGYSFDIDPGVKSITISFKLKEGSSEGIEAKIKACYSSDGTFFYINQAD